MTATQSNGSAKRNPFLNNLWFKISDNRLLFLVNSVLQVCGMLITVISILLVLHADKEYDVRGDLSRFWYFWQDNGFAFMLLGMGMFAIGLLLMMPIAFGCFDYLYKKARVDMILSLPMTSSQRFWSDYLTGLAMSVVPTLVSIILGVSIGGFGFWAIMEGYQEWRYGFIMILMEIVPLLLGCLSLYSVTVFVLCCCGSRTEAPLTLLAFIVVPPMLVGLFWVALESMADYMYTASELMYFLKFTGPFGSAMMAVEWFDIAELASSTSEFPYFALFVWAVQYLLGTALLVLISWRLYLHRKAEDTSKPFVYRFLYHLLMAACVFTFFLFFIAIESSEELLIPVAIFGMIAYLLVEVGVHRTIKRLYIAFARYVITAMLSVLLIVTASETECFGMQRYIPDASAVYSVDGHMPRFDVLSGASDDFYYELTDHESIEFLTELQKQSEWKKSGVGGRDMTAYYTLNIGMEMTRYTENLSKAEMEKLAEFQLRPEIFEQITKRYGYYEGRKGVTVRCYGTGYDVILTEQQTKELWELYLSASRDLTVEKLYQEPVAYLADMPLYAGVHEPVEDYILEHGGMPAGSEFALTPDMVAGAPVLISTDSTWYNKIERDGIENIVYQYSDSMEADAVYDGITVGYTPEQIAALGFGVTLFADKPEWVVSIGGRLYPVLNEYADEAAALAEQGKTLSAQELEHAVYYSMLNISSPQKLFYGVHVDELQYLEQGGILDTYRKLYPHGVEDLEIMLTERYAEEFMQYEP